MMWHRNTDLTYVTDMAEFSRNPVHPETGEPVSRDEFERCLKPKTNGDEIQWWYGQLDNGAYVLIYND
jgi:hypothetical protein